MNKKNLLLILFAGLSFGMVALVVNTSLKSNLFEVLPYLNSEPWFVTTIVDFYFNIVIISVWVVYKEKSHFKALIWIISFILLGSISTAFYVFLQIITLKQNDTMDQVVLRKV